MEPTADSQSVEKRIPASSQFLAPAYEPKAASVASAIRPLGRSDEPALLRVEQRLIKGLRGVRRRNSSRSSPSPPRGRRSTTSAIHAHVDHGDRRRARTVRGRVATNLIRSRPSRVTGRRSGSHRRPRGRRGTFSGVALAAASARSPCARPWPVTSSSAVPEPSHGSPAAAGRATRSTFSWLSPPLVTISDSSTSAHFAQQARRLPGLPLAPDLRLSAGGRKPGRARVSSRSMHDADCDRRAWPRTGRFVGAGEDALVVGDAARMPGSRRPRSSIETSTPLKFWLSSGSPQGSARSPRGRIGARHEDQKTPRRRCDTRSRTREAACGSCRRRRAGRRRRSRARVVVDFLETVPSRRTIPSHGVARDLRLLLELGDAAVSALRLSMPCELIEGRPRRDASRSAAQSGAGGRDRAGRAASSATGAIFRLSVAVRVVARSPWGSLRQRMPRQPSWQTRSERPRPPAGEGRVEREAAHGK
jgi:hypothetical protein